MESKERNEEGEDEVVQCARLGCAEAGKWRPILLLKPANYAGRPNNMPLPIQVCDAHREKLPDKFITEEFWKAILMHFDKQNRTRPHRILTEVRYEIATDQDEIGIAPEPTIH